MRRLLYLLVLLGASAAFAQRGGGTLPPFSNFAASCGSDVGEDTSCAGYERTWCVNYTTATIYACNPTTHAWNAVGSSATGGLSDGDKGDITVSSNGSAWDLDAGVVTATELAAASITAADAASDMATQAEIDLKANIASPTFTGTVVIPTPFTLGAVSVTTTGTELNYVAGVTSALQTQMDTKVGNTPADGFLIDFGTNLNSSTEGIYIPANATSCSTATAEGQLCWEEDANILWVGNGATAEQIGPGSASGDVTAVGDCTSGACLGGASSGGTSIQLYNAGGNVTFTAGAATLDITTPVTASSFTADDNTTTGNLIVMYDNLDVTPDPTCAAGGTADALTVIDSDETSAEVWDLCDGTALKFRLPAVSTTVTHVLHATATSGAPAFSALLVADLPITGVWDMGGEIDLSTGSIGLPSGTGPTVDEVGEIALDTTADQLKIYNGTTTKVWDPRETLSVVIMAPVDADSPLIFKAPYGMTITNIDCITQAATSAVIDIQECTSAGASCATVDAAVTCDSDGAADDGSLSNSSIDSGDWIKLDMGTVTGSVLSVTVTVKYTVVGE